MVLRSKLLTSGEFARLANTTKDTLMFYERVGVLKPVLRKNNRYRFYCYTQVRLYHAIITFQALGMSLAQIKEYMEERNSEVLVRIVEQRLQQFDEEQSKIDATRELTWAIRQHLQEGVRLQQMLNHEVELNRAYVQRLPSCSIVLGRSMDHHGAVYYHYGQGQFWEDVEQRMPGIARNYPLCGQHSMERVLGGDWHVPDRYYIKYDDSAQQRPAGLYVLGYTRCGYGQAQSLFEILYRYILSSAYMIAGPAYEEYIVNELLVKECCNYLVCIMIPVRRRLDAVVFDDADETVRERMMQERL